MSRKTKKLIWSAPLVAALAVLGALAIFAVLAPNGAQAEHLERPGYVTDLKAEATGRAMIEISWKNPEGPVDSYRIDTSDDTYVWESKEMMTTEVARAADGVMTYTDMVKLDAGDTRYYRVFAINGAGTGLAPLQDYVRADGIANVAPGASNDLMATAVSHNQINLTWSQPANTGHTSITFYCISVSRPNTAIAVLVDTNDDANECSEGLEDSDVTTDAEIATLNASLVAATPTGGTIVVEADGDGQQMYEHKGLTANTQYRYRVTAVNSVGRSATASNIDDAVTHATPSAAVATDAVRNLRGVAPTTTTVNLYWNLPQDQVAASMENGFTIDYEVETATHPTLPSATSTLWQDDTGSAGDDSAAHEWATTVTAPTGNDRIHYRVRKSGNGTWSMFTFSPKVWGGDADRLVPGVPELPDGSDADTDPDSPTADAMGSLTQITLTWSFIPPAADAADPKPQRPTGYELDWVKGDGTVGDTPPDIDGEQQHWRSVLPEGRSGYARSPITQRDLTAGTEYVYRIFPYKDGVYGAPVVVNAMTAPATAPDTRLNLSVTAEGPTKLKLMWDAPASDNGSAVTGYLIQVGDDVDDNRTFEPGGSTANAADRNDWVSVHDTDYNSSITFVGSDANPQNHVVGSDGDQDEWDIEDPDTREYVYQNLNPNDARWFRVIALNGVASVTGVENDEDTLSIEAIDALGSAEPVRGQTARATVPAAPNGLVTETARNSSLTGAANRGVLLLWNAPEDPLGAPLTGYVIARKVNDGAWDDDWQNITEPNPRTYLTDSAVPTATEMRYYRVAARNSAGTGAWSNTSVYRADGMAMHSHRADAPTGATATADSAEQITVSWNAPANNGGADITHYIIERRYAGDMAGDIPSDGYNAAAGGASFAFSNHMEWWETLNCKGMLAAAGSSEMPAGAGETKSADEMMYCAHYADTEPTNMAGTIMAGDATDMEIEELFDKRYVITGDAMTTHVDMGLMANTEYTYRVSAVNSVGRSMWSSPVMATTEALPLAKPMVDATPGEGSVMLSWDMAGGAVEYTVWVARPDASPVREGGSDLFIKDANITGMSHEVTGLVSGAEYWIVVAACGVEDCDNAQPGEYIHSDVAVIMPN